MSSIDDTYRNTFRDWLAVGRPQSNDGTVLQSAQNLYRRKVQRADIHWNPLERPTGDLVDVIATPLDMKSLPGNRKCVVDRLSDHRNDHGRVRQQHSVCVLDARQDFPNRTSAIRNDV